MAEDKDPDADPNFGPDGPESLAQQQALKKNRLLFMFEDAGLNSVAMCHVLLYISFIGERR